MTHANRVHEVRIVNVRLKSKWRPKVTDHALARYLSRAMGIAIADDQIKQARKDLLCKEVELAILIGAPVAIVNGYKIILEGNNVVTVLTADMQTMDEKAVATGNAYRRGLAALEALNSRHPLGAS